MAGENSYGVRGADAIALCATTKILTIGTGQTNERPMEEILPLPLDKDQVENT